MNKQIIPLERIASKIFIIRKHSVMLDKDLAELYCVETRHLKQAVRRNIERFPDDFMFELTKDEFQNLRSHFDTSRWGGTRYTPMVFTEQGVAMLSSVLKSDRAVKVNIAIMRTFVQLRQMLASNVELRQKLDEMEKNYDEQFKLVFTAIKQLMESPPPKPKRKIGFLQ